MCVFMYLCVCMCVCAAASLSYRDPEARRAGAFVLETD